MKTAQMQWTASQGWSASDGFSPEAQLAIYFGSRQALTETRWLKELKELLPKAILIGCSTGGQILDSDVLDEPIVAIAMTFAKTRVAVASRKITEPSQSESIGEELGRELKDNDLRHVFVLSEGLKINGSALVDGISSQIGAAVSVSGGLAGDGADFQETLVAANGSPESGTIAALGFYGDSIVVGLGSEGGWDEFGPKRAITRSSGNLLYDLDGKPALELYKKYLGEEADQLPGSALLYPLMIVDPSNPQRRIVRTILSVDETAGSMTFAGNVPQGWTAQLMLGRFDRLADGAARAVEQTHVAEQTDSDAATLLVSCIGRRILMGQNVIDETLAARAAAPRHAKIIGFYSYGEIAPHRSGAHCELHNQTITVTTLSERI